MASNPVSIGDISGIAFQGVGLGIVAGTSMGAMRMMERGLYGPRYGKGRGQAKKARRQQHINKMKRPRQRIQYGYWRG